MPILTAVGIVTEELAVLWVTLIGAILVPGLAISDQNKMEQATEDSYFHGVDEGWQAANDDNRRGIELATERDIPRGKRGLYE